MMKIYPYLSVKIQYFTLVMITVVISFCLDAYAETGNMTLDGLTRDIQGVVFLPILQINGVIKNPNTGIPARKCPDASAPFVMTIKTFSDVLTVTIAQETCAAVVFGQTIGWLQVQTRYGKGWISRKNIEEFVPVENLFKGKLTFLDVSKWDKKLFIGPSLLEKPLEIPNIPEANHYVDIEFLEWAWSEGQPWMKIKILAEYSCGGGKQFDEDVIGWLPVYAINGKSPVWYCELGC